MSEKKSLFEVIKENLVNGELPDDFSLPREEAGEDERFQLLAAKC